MFFGLHKKTPERKISFEEAAQGIQRQLSEEAAQVNIAQELQELMKKYKVERYDQTQVLETSQNQ